MQADLTHARLSAQLRTTRYGRSLELKESTESTNDDARAAIALGVPDGHVIVADTQTRGRGSRGRSWSSPAGSDLYFSVVAHVPLPLAQLPPLTLAVGVALSEAVAEWLPPQVRVEVKWPNDLWLDRKKCAGILLEASSQSGQTQSAVIGIGLNVNRRDFPADIEHEPTSLALASGADLDRGQVLSRVLEQLETWVDRFVAEGIGPLLSALEPKLALRGEVASCDDVVGVVAGVTREGALRMRTESGSIDVVAGTLRALRS